MAFLSGYTTRKKLTIDHTKFSATQSDFIVLVKLTTTRFDFSKSNSDGFDIRFTSSDGETLLKYERERHDGSNYAEYHVKIPSVSHEADTDFYIYYRTTDTSDGADPTNVWNSDFKVVLHLKDDPDTSHCQDSTSNNCDLTKKGAGEPVEADGYIAKGQNFDGSNDYATFANSLLSNKNTCFISMMVKLSPVAGSNTAQMLLYKFKDASNHVYLYLSGIDSGVGDERLALAGTNGGSWTYAVHTGTNLGEHGISDGNWHHIFIYYNGGTTGKIYVDGVDKTSYSAATTFYTGTENTLLGQNDTNFIKGMIDEFRLSDVARSIAWGMAEYYSITDVLLTYGSEELAPTFIPQIIIH